MILQKKALRTNGLLSQILSRDSLNNLYHILKEGGMKFSIYSRGNDVRKDWESRIVLDVDYDGDFMLLSFDDSLKSKYRAFFVNR